MVTYQNRRIVYSLEYGYRYTDKKILIILGCSIGGILLFGLAACIGFGITEKDHCQSAGFLVSIIFTVFLALPLLFLMLFNPIIQKRHDKQIVKWLQADQVITKTVKPWLLMTYERSAGRTILAPTYRFGVSFRYGGEEHNIRSKHFDRFYKSVEGKKIDILYIPEYDQVLVLE